MEQFFPITNSQVIGTAPDGSPLRTWNEGSRTFMETYGYSEPIGELGTVYGLVIVVETTS